MAVLFSLFVWVFDCIDQSGCCSHSLPGAQGEAWRGGGGGGGGVNQYLSTPYISSAHKTVPPNHSHSREESEPDMHY